MRFKVIEVKSLEELEKMKGVFMPEIVFFEDKGRNETSIKYLDGRSTNEIRACSFDYFKELTSCSSLKKIASYSSYEEERFCISGVGENVSRINDKLIRLAAKLTESYAGDIFYVMDLLESRKGQAPFSQLLGFRESGVDVTYIPYCISSNDNVRCEVAFDLNSYYQFWLLSHDGKDKTTLTRVRIY